MRQKSRIYRFLVLHYLGVINATYCNKLTKRNKGNIELYFKNKVGFESNERK